MNVRNSVESIAQSIAAQATTAAGNVKSSQDPGKALASDTARVSVAATQVAQSSSASDVRPDKVASIRSQLEAGTYSVAASDVARKLVDSLITDTK